MQLRADDQGMVMHARSIEHEAGVVNLFFSYLELDRHAMQQAASMPFELASSAVGVIRHSPSAS
ncbi:hypothetical protein ACLOJK_013764 [Asimina triloba]